MNSLGRHILAEYYGCSAEILNDASKIENSMVKAAEDAEATVINSTFHHFSPYGVSGVVVIQESHLAIHTWPEYGYAAVDLFTCGDSVNPWICFEILKKAFESKNFSALEMNRGQLDLLEKQDFDIKGSREERKPKPKYNRNVWLTDKNENIASSFRHTGEILFKKKSPYQLVEVLDTYAYGKMLSIDKMVMTTDKDEYVYHEMIAHPAMLTHNSPKKVLVIGGGDGGTIREVLKHESVEQVVMVEIDGAVVEACKEHFPKIASQFDNPKLELIIGDGIEYVKNAAEKTFDVVIIDGSDPVGPAEGLFSKSFFQNVNRVLKDDGIMVAQSESPRFNENAFIDLFKVYDEVFGQQNVYPYTAYIPTYPSGMWAFAYCTKKSINIDRLQVGKIVQFCQNNELDYYNLGVHQGAFSLPNFVKKMLGR